jgi:hypothetical protein
MDVNDLALTVGRAKVEQPNIHELRRVLFSIADASRKSQVAFGFSARQNSQMVLQTSYHPAFADNQVGQLPAS